MWNSARRHSSRSAQLFNVSFWNVCIVRFHLNGDELEAYREFVFWFCTCWKSTRTMCTHCIIIQSKPNPKTNTNRQKRSQRIEGNEQNFCIKAEQPERKFPWKSAIFETIFSHWIAFQARIFLLRCVPLCIYSKTIWRKCVHIIFYTAQFTHAASHSKNTRILLLLLLMLLLPAISHLVRLLFPPIHTVIVYCDSHPIHIAYNIYSFQLYCLSCFRYGNCVHFRSL